VISQHHGVDQTAMPKFAVFFSDGAGFGIEMVQALDVAHAEDITRAQHPTGRLSAVPAELVEWRRPPQAACSVAQGGGVSWAGARFRLRASACCSWVGSNERSR
jgi:hypothetical protein